jgi:hypothetical protein
MFNRHSKPAPFVPRTGDDAPQGLALYHDVGYGLRRARSQRTRTFRIPMVYSNPLADLCATQPHYISDARDLTCFVIHSNNWDTMFMERLVGDITMHKPLVAPGVVLALGNGFDFWAIRAAQKWPVCIHLGSNPLTYSDLVTSIYRSAGSRPTVFWVCTRTEWTPSFDH